MVLMCGNSIGELQTLLIPDAGTHIHTEPGESSYCDRQFSQLAS